MNTKSFLYFELFLLFILLPLFVYRFGFIMPPSGFLAAVIFYIIYIYNRHHPKQEEHFFSFNYFKKKAVYYILRRFYISTLLLILFILAYDYDLLFQWVFEKPFLWIIIITLYPLLSVVPQELVFRGFFFARYRKLFPSKKKMIYASAVMFGFAHIIFHNSIAVVLSFVGGLYFASTYTRSRSLKLVVMEHSLYGIVIFTVGFGEFFYHGYVKLQ